MPTPSHPAELVREHRPLEGARLHGVTFDGRWVWFAAQDALVACEPETGKVVRRHLVPGADAGTAFDGEHLYQLARGEVLVIHPDSGDIVRRFPAPGKGRDTGMAWGDGYLWIGQYNDLKIHKVDARSGTVVKTLTSDRFVTGVSCVGGALWHGACGDGQPCELRRLAPDGTVAESLALPVEWVAGVEGVGDDSFWCAGEGGTLRLVRRKDR